MEKLMDKNIKNKLTMPIVLTLRTIFKMGQDVSVSLETLRKNCEYFQCDIGDIIEYKSEER